MKRIGFRQPFFLRWWFIGLAAVCAFVLGLWGFYAYFAANPAEPRSSFPDVLYRTLQMFFFNWDPLRAEMPGQLQAARFLAAYVALSTVIGFLVEFCHRRLERLWLRWVWRRHVVVCGLGQHGADLVVDLCTRKKRVVVIEDQEDHPGLARCRERGAIVLAGPPADPVTLAEARIDRADTLVALFQEDAANVEVFMQARQRSAGRSRDPLPCVVQVFDHEIQDLLRRHQSFRDPHSPVRLELFNLFDVGAQVMLLENPALYKKHEPRRLVIVGMGWLGQSLLVRVARAWRIEQMARHGVPDGPREVIAIDRCTDGLKTRLTMACPFLDEVCQLKICDMDVQGTDFLAGRYLPQQDTSNTFDAGFVCLPDDRLALLTAFRLRERFGPEVPLVVAMTSCNGLGRLLAPEVTANLHLIDLHDLAGTMHLVTTAATEMLAREIHRDYVQDQYHRDPNWARNQAMVPWHLLSEDWRKANREQAAHVEAKLRMLGCEAVPVREVRRLREWKEDEKDNEVERLARAEHERWCEERKASGWRWGKVKDVARKLTPYLVDYKDLPDGIKETNRATVRRIPVWLAKAGFEIRDVPR